MHLVYYGHFSYSDVYQMPIPFRRFYYNMLIEIKEKENGDGTKENNEKVRASEKLRQKENLNKEKKSQPITVKNAK